MPASASARFILIVLSSVTILFLVPQTSCHDFDRRHAARLRRFTAKIDEIVSLSDHQPSISVRPPPKVGGVFYPIGYGADPTGHNDSTDAIQNALNDAFQQLSDEKQKLMPGVKDLGGAVIDLLGGQYRITKPISFPASGGGGLLMKQGSLRASKGFPADRFLVEILSPESEVLIHKTEDVAELQGGGRIHYEDIAFKDILFDSGYSGGGLLVVDAARTQITDCYFMNFTTQGILVQGGHETYIQSCFVGQRPTTGKGSGEANYSGTGIDLAGNDNIVTDTVIFSAEIGLLVRGHANMIRGVHTYNKARIFGGIGILVKSHADYSRIDDCFIDYNSVVLEDPSFVQLSKSFFLGYANVVLKAVEGRVAGLAITDNFFRGIDMAPIVELQGKFREIRDVTVQHNQAWNATVKATTAKMAVARKGDKWVADFSRILLFPDKIEYFQYSVFVKEPPRPIVVVAGGVGEAAPPLGVPRFTVHAASDVSRNKVVVESENVVDAIVSVVVDQCNPV